MKTLCGVWLVIAMLGGFAAGQDYSKVDMFAGYTYVNVDTNDLAQSRQDMNGWNASISVSAHKFFAIEGDVSGYYKNYNVEGYSVNVRDYAFAAGPRINVKPFFVHVLLGVDRLSGNVETGVSNISASASQNAFTSLFGGGMQVKISPHWALRTSADYVLTHHNIFKVVNPSAPNYTQNNFRVGVGIVFLYGEGKDSNALLDMRHDDTRPIDRRDGTAARLIPALGITGAPEADGVRITAIAPNSPAERASFTVGDVVLTVNGKPVATVEQLAAAAGDRGEAAMTFRHKAWTMNTVVKLD